MFKKKKNLKIFQKRLTKLINKILRDFFYRKGVREKRETEKKERHRKRKGVREKRERHRVRREKKVKRERHTHTRTHTKRER